MTIVLALLFCWTRSYATVYDTYTATETKGSFCSVVGGACAGQLDFDNGFFQNPAALGVGPAGFDFDFDLDLERQTVREPGSVGVDAVGNQQTMGALAFALETFGFGVSYVKDDIRTRASALNGRTIETRVTERTLNFPLGIKINPRLKVGASLQVAWAHVTTQASPPIRIEDRSANRPALGLTLGALFEPTPRLSVGAWLRLPSHYRGQENADSIELRRDFQRPAVFALGAAHVFPNRLEALAQMEVVGQSPSGFLYSGNDLALIETGRTPAPKGRAVSFEPRFGLKAELSQPWTLYSGAYLETSRTAGADARAHATIGLSYKVRLDLSWWDFAEFMLGFDGARDYQRWFITFR